MPIEVSAKDTANAEQFLATALADLVPTGQFMDGTALRDIAIKALAAVSAFQRKEAGEIRNLRSLLHIREAAREGTTPDLDAAADAHLSNWFIYRKGGDFARGVVQVFVSRRQDYPIPRSAVFYFDPVLAFYPDSTTDLVIPASDLSPVVDSTGAVASYVFSLRLIAARTGESYNVPPGRWSGTGGFSTFVQRVQHLSHFAGGAPQQGTVDLIDQSRNAITVRNLINIRSVNTVLTQKFRSLNRLTVVGMGEPEMQRDYNPDLNLHLGGYYDVYVELPVASTSFEGVVGGVFTRPDGIVCVFGDTAVPDWTATAVQVGDVLRVTSAANPSPRDYPIREVRETQLYVSEKRPFPAAGTGLTWYIYRPLFGSDVRIHPTSGTSSTGYTTATSQTPGRITLPGEPLYEILDVAIVNPDAGSPYINDPDGAIHLRVRTNNTPVLTQEGNESSYRVLGRKPGEAQSALALTELEVPSALEGRRVRVTYQTLAGFQAISQYTRDRYERVLSANVLVKGLHPIYLSFTVPYTLSPRALQAVDEAGLRRALTQYINTFDHRDTLDVSDITTFVKNFDPLNIGTVHAFVVNYFLYAPDGQVISFETNDVVGMAPEYIIDDSGLTAEGLLSLGVSDRTVRYLTDLSFIQLERR